MSEIDRAELRRLLDEATPGPWVAVGSQVWRPDGVPVAAVREPNMIGDRPDSLIIAAAVNALPGLLDALEEAETAIELVDEVMGVLEAILPDLLARAWNQGRWAEQRYQEPCLLHDITGEDVPGWEMAECTCEDLTNPYRQESDR